MHTWLRALSLSLVVALSACGGGGSSSTGQDAADGKLRLFLCRPELHFRQCQHQPGHRHPHRLHLDLRRRLAHGGTVDTAHTYAAASTYTVSLLVIDSQGLRTTATKSVTVTAPPAGPAPHASFNVSCLSLDCTFTDTSTYDAGSTPHSRLWDFGDTVTLATTNPADAHLRDPRRCPPPTPRVSP